MNKPGWYLLAYDVTEPLRLQRLHRYLRKKALAVQQSVFFFHGTEAELQVTLNEVTQIIHIRKDDVRAYPIEHPSQVWLAGPSVVDGPLLRPPEIGIRRVQRSEPKQGGLGGLITRLWRKDHVQ